MTENYTEPKPILFNRIAIIVFSCFLSTIFGGILYSQNLWNTDNRKSITPVMLFCLGWNLLIMQIVSKHTSNFLFTFVLPNIIGGVLLAFPFWNYHFKDISSYANKKIWGPLLVVIVLYGIMVVGSIIQGSHTKTKEGENIYQVGQDDIEMNEAIQQSRNTFTDFRMAFSALDTFNTEFGVKIPIHAETEVENEHMWLSDIHLRENEFYGVISNFPEFTSKVKLGDTIKIDSTLISDWMYLRNGKLKGGFSIHLLYKRMTRQEQKEFDSICTFRVEG